MRNKKDVIPQSTFFFTPSFYLALIIGIQVEFLLNLLCSRICGLRQF